MNRDYVGDLIVNELAALPRIGGGNEEPYEVHLRDNPTEPCFTTHGAIVLSLRFLEHLWWLCCHSLLTYWAAFKSLEQDPPENPGQLVDYDTRIYAAYENYIWSRKSISDDLFLDTRSDVPLEDKEQNQVDVLFLVAVAWIIYHETAHIELEHREDSVSNEEAADDFADAKIAKWPEAPDDGFTYRLGIISAVFSVMSFQLERGVIREETHPHPYKRLLRRIDGFGVPEDDDEYLISSLRLRTELIRLGVSLDDEEPAPSLRSAFEYLIGKLETYVAENADRHG